MELKRLTKEAAREEQEVLRRANAEAAASATKVQEEEGHGQPRLPSAIVVSGCGSEEVNGTYRVDGTRDGVPSYRIERADGDDRPSFTIERDSAPDQATQFCLCVDYGFVTWCFVDSDSDAPPCNGWAVSEETCSGPPPCLAATDGCTTLPAEPLILGGDACSDLDLPGNTAGGWTNAAPHQQGHGALKKRRAAYGFRVSKGVQKKRSSLAKKGRR
jgi:hypothetical protein